MAGFATMLTRLTASAIGGPNQGMIPLHLQKRSAPLICEEPFSYLLWLAALLCSCCCSQGPNARSLLKGLGAYAYNVENTVLGSRGLDDWACE